MRKNRILLIFVLLLLTATAVPGQTRLGPRDGANLPPADLNRIALGAEAPDFTLENYDGKTFTLSDYKGKRTVVLVFYRGYW